MHGWARTVVTAAAHVADRPSLWLPGGLAWVLTVGWLVLLVGVARAPTIAELTFFGAGFYTSGAWPWNLVAVTGGTGLALASAVALVAVAEATLLRGTRATADDAGRVMLLSILCALPALAALAALAVGFGEIAQAEFNSPQDAGGPLVRIVLRLLPLVIVVLLTIVAGAAIHAAAARRALRGRSILGSLREAPFLLARTGAAALAQAAALNAMRLAFAGLAALLLRVLWAPIEERLALNGIDAAGMLLLVGFVAIWLCVVLAGGALHAWGSVSWTGVLGTGATDRGPSRDEMEPSTQP